MGWYHDIDLGDGLHTKSRVFSEDPDHPRRRWANIERAVSKDLTGMNITLKWDLDASRVDAQREDVEDNPEVAALLEAISLGAHERSEDPVPVAWIEKEAVGEEASIIAFRPRAFYQWASARGYALPGGERATKQLLMIATAG